MCHQDCLHFQHPGKIIQMETILYVPAKCCGVLRVLVAEAVPYNTSRLPASAGSCMQSPYIFDWKCFK